MGVSSLCYHYVKFFHSSLPRNSLLLCSVNAACSFMVTALSDSAMQECESSSFQLISSFLKFFVPKIHLSLLFSAHF